MNEVYTKRGKVVSTGNFAYSTLDNDFNNILLTSITVKSPNIGNHGYICTCINLHIDGYGISPEKANQDMIDSVRYFLDQNFKLLSGSDAWRNIIELLDVDEWAIELWNAYYEFNKIKGILC